MKELWTLFWVFFRIGAVTFGGGYAMLPMFRKELVEKQGWVTEEDILDYYAIGQCTPGVIAVNTATFVGNKQRGVIGGIVATAGIVAPSLLIITIIAAFISNFAEITYVQQAFAGIRVVVLVLIADTVIALWKKGVKDKFGLVIVAFVVITNFIPAVSPMITVLVCAVAGIFYYGRKGAKA